MRYKKLYIARAIARIFFWLWFACGLIRAVSDDWGPISTAVKDFREHSWDTSSVLWAIFASLGSFFVSLAVLIVLIPLVRMLFLLVLEEVVTVVEHSKSYHYSRADIQEILEKNYANLNERIGWKIIGMLSKGRLFYCMLNECCLACKFSRKKGENFEEGISDEEQKYLIYSKNEEKSNVSYFNKLFGRIKENAGQPPLLKSLAIALTNYFLGK